MSTRILLGKHIKCQCCPQIETSQLICRENQLTGFYMRATRALTGFKEDNLSQRNCQNPFSHPGLQGISQKIKTAGAFSWKWEIRVVFMKSGHHSWQQENFFSYNPLIAGKYHLGEKYFRVWHCTTHKSPLGNVRFFVYHKLGTWNRNKQADWFWLDKSSK